MFPKPSDKTAIYIEDTEISYNQLIKNIFAYALNLKIKKGERVILFAENSPEWIYAFYSIWVKKGIAVHCDYNLNEKEISYIINNCNPKIVYVSKNSLATVKKALKYVRNKPKVIIMEEQKLNTRVSIQFPEINYNDIAIIMYTSGTTGKPKGVMLTYDNLLCSIQAIADLRMLTEHDRMIAKSTRLKSVV